MLTHIVCCRGWAGQMGLPMCCAFLSHPYSNSDSHAPLFQPPEIGNVLRGSGLNPTNAEIDGYIAQCDADGNATCKCGVT